MENRELVVLVDESGEDKYEDGKLCLLKKIEAHRRGLLHRAVSIFIFNDRNELLLQKRSPGKYHSPDIWSNTCCTHPLPNEIPQKTARRRLKEEMGLTAKLTEKFTFIYRADVGGGLMEYEFDHVFFGVTNQQPDPDPVEVSDWAWMPIKNLKDELIRFPEKYSPWLRQCFDKVVDYKLGI
jgi:isopentenyl-diphosphate delta-isomerase